MVKYVCRCVSVITTLLISDWMKDCESSPQDASTEYTQPFRGQTLKHKVSHEALLICDKNSSYKDKPQKYTSPPRAATKKRWNIFKLLLNLLLFFLSKSTFWFLLHINKLSKFLHNTQFRSLIFSCFSRQHESVLSPILSFFFSHIL